MRDIFLKNIGSALPAWEVDSDTLAQWCEADPEFIRNKVGIRKRHFLRPEESPTELAVQACENLFSKTEGRKQDVDLLIFVSQNPEYGLPHSSALLQHRLGLSTRTACLDVGLGCSGYVHALSVARGMMLSEGFENALLITCDPYSRIMHRQDKNTVTVFGDAATASWLGTDRGAAIGKVDFGTDGGGAPALTLSAPRQGLLKDAFCPDMASPCLPPSLSMNGRGVFNFMLQRVPASVAACLEKNNLTGDDIDYYVFHQASRFMLQTLTAHMGLSGEKVPVLLDDVGNTVSSSIPLALETLVNRNVLRGKTVLLSGFGVGLSWASIILYFQGES